MKKSTITYFAAFLFLLFLNQFSYSQEEVLLTAKEREIFESSEDDRNIEEVDTSEFDIVIMDIGFYTWLNRIAQPKGYYSQSFMENRNYIYVLEWNRRVLEPRVFDPQLYELQINYEQGIDYGYDVNYQLYNYFIYFQRRYKQRLGPFLPRI